MDWRDANGVEGIHTCSHRCTRPACMDARLEETERLRTEAARLLALFAEQWAHPASALYFTAQALGHKTIPDSGIIPSQIKPDKSLVSQPDGSQAPQH